MTHAGAAGAELPARIGPYAVHSEMARGGAGVVYKCQHLESGQLAAVKTARDSGRLHRAFLRKEIAILSRLTQSGYTGVVGVRDHGLDRDILWYAMEFIEGVDVSWLIRRLWSSGWPQRMIGDELGFSEGERTQLVAEEPSACAGHLREVLALMRRLASILSFVHAEGIVHADLTPRNILLRPDGRPVLVDFGTALHAFSDGVSREVAQVQGMLHGTPGYMAPEQILGQSLDARCDLYALGCVLYELITNRPPFRAHDRAALRDQHLHLAPPAPSSQVTGVPEALDVLVLGLLEKDPQRRIGYAEEVVERLVAMGAGKPEVRPGTRTMHLYRPRLVGRKEPLDRLTGFLRRAGEGSGTCVFVSGESGIGKTRLVNELGSRAVADRFEVVLGRCEPTQREVGHDGIEGPAFQPFASLFQRMADLCLTSSEGMGARLQDVLPVLSPYEPTLASVSRAHSAQPPLPLEPELGRKRVLRALADGMRVFAAERPLLMILDDIQWADDLTLAFLDSSQEGVLDGSRVLLVATVRSEHGQPGLTKLLRAAGDRHLALGRLNRDDVASMIKDSIAASLVPAAWSEALHQQSEGNPFFVAEYLRAAAEQGSLVRGRPDEWAPPPIFPAAKDPALTMPASLRSSVEQRINELSPAAREVLDLVSVLGREFDAEVLDAFGGVRAAIALEELTARRILEEPAPGHYRFLHDKIRETCEEGIAPDLRVQLHRRAAEQLAALDAGLPESNRHDAALGGHWVAAGDTARAYHHLIRAARHAEALHATGQAIQLLRLAIDQHSWLGSPDAAWADRHVSMIESLGDLLQTASRHEEARECYQAILAGFRLNNRLLRARLERKVGDSFWKAHQYEPARAALERAESQLGTVEALASAEELIEWIDLHRSRFFTLYFDRRVEEIPGLIRKVHPVIERHGTPSHRYFLYQSMAMGAMAAGGYRRSTEAIQLARKAVDQVAHNPRHLKDWYDGRFTLGMVHLMGDHGDCAQAAAWLGDLARETERIGDALLQSRIVTYLAIAHRRLGQIEAAEKAAGEALRAAETAKQWPYIGAARACLAWAAWKSGRRVQAAAAAEQAIADWRRTPHHFPFHWLAYLVLLDLYRGDDQIEKLAPILRSLTEKGQQTFPAPLQDALLSAASAASDDLARGVDKLLLLAGDLGYL